MPTLESLASSLDPRVNESRGDVTLTVLSIKDDSPRALFAFQYFPETITDSKEVNYQTKDIPGGSLPLQQWISGGERTIAFSAFFTSDVDLLAQGRTKATQLKTLLREAGVERQNIDIRTALAFLGNLQAPSYSGTSDTGVALVLAPPKVLLTIPGSGIGVTRGIQDKRSPLPDSMVAILKQCEIEYQAFFPSGMPRVVSVSLSFAQVAQYGGKVVFPQAYAATPGEDISQGMKFGGAGEFYAYPVRPRKGKGV
jgi:hypothetical protein